MSTCGLVAAGLLRRLVDLPWDGADYWAFPAPYHGLDIVTCLSLLGVETHAAHRRAPRVGDVACIGAGLTTHVLTVVDVAGDIVTSVDGGQVGPDGLQCCKRVVRQWSKQQVVWVLDLVALEAYLPRWSWLVEDT